MGCLLSFSISPFSLKTKRNASRHFLLNGCLFFILLAIRCMAWNKSGLIGRTPTTPCNKSLQMQKLSIENPFHSTFFSLLWIPVISVLTLLKPVPLVSCQPRTMPSSFITENKLSYWRIHLPFCHIPTLPATLNVWLKAKFLWMMTSKHCRGFHLWNYYNSEQSIGELVFF